MKSTNETPPSGGRGVKLLLSILLLSLTLSAQVTFPEPSQLPKIDTLPDILTFMDGSKVKIKENWSKRRDEIKNLMQFYEYGFLPPAPGNVTSVDLTTNDTIFKGKGIYKMTRLNMGPENKISFVIHVYLPKGKGPFPVVLDGDLCWKSYKKQIEKFVQKGYAVIEFDRTDLDKDNDNRLDGLHAFYPGDYGTLAVWAWAYHRVVDYVVSQPTFDKSKIAATGHSRGGKTVLLAAAMDERIALVAPNNSGSCGTGPLRCVFTGEAINNITDPKWFYYWFNPRFSKFRDSEITRLPYDQHAVMALVAPRALLSTNALGDIWANPHGTQTAHLEAKKIWEALNADEKIAILNREGIHEHNENDWMALLDFCEKTFYNKKVNTAFDNYFFPKTTERYPNK